MAIRFIGASVGCGAQDHRTERGPDELRKQGGWQDIVLPDRFSDTSWDTTIYTRGKLKKGDQAMQSIVEFSYRLQKIVGKTISDGDFPVVIGGDHSCAIGTWSGISRTLNDYGQGKLGLIWIDAHLDAHTFETTPSNAVHGMPLAVLLGYGKHELVNICQPKQKLLPENVKVIGVRSYEDGEKRLLDNLGVEVYYMDEVKKFGFQKIFTHCKETLCKNVNYYGISLDLDVFDPTEIPGVGSPEQNGILIKDAIETFSTSNLSNDQKFICFELAEFSPALDDGKSSAKISNIFQAVLGKNQ